jgi:putative ABC transport system permease protein
VGVEAAAADRVIVRNSVSFIFPIPYAYKDKLEKIDGVKRVTWANWFGGVYKEKENFFGRLAVDHNTFLDVYPEFLITPDEKKMFMDDIQSCIIGEGNCKSV